MTNESEIVWLRRKMKEITDYPDGIERIEDGSGSYINGISFFPGGRGLYKNEDETISNKRIMVVGQDFDTMENFLKARDAGKEDIEKNKTWKTLLRLLRDCSLNEHQCFFTNIIVGLRKGKTNTGRSVAFKNQKFLEQNKVFFKEQLICQKPKNILLLGYYPASFLTNTISVEQLKPWRSYKTLSAFYKNADALKEDVSFDLDGTIFNANILVIPHPSMLNSNLKYVYHDSLKPKEALQYLLEEWGSSKKRNVVS